MRIHVNGEPREVPSPLDVAQLLKLLELDPKYLAVEKNRELVPRQAQVGTQLHENDEIEIVTLVGGG